MDNIVKYLKTPLLWEFKKKKALLKSGDKTILELKAGKKRATFKQDDKIYTICNKGFWNPTTLIEEDKNNIAVLQCFSRGNTAWIEFASGSRYLLKAKNQIFIKLSIHSSDRKELVRNKLISKSKAVMNIHINNSEVPNSDIVLLMILGCFIFRGIIKENKTTGLDSIVFSGAVPDKEIIITEPV